MPIEFLGTVLLEGTERIPYWEEIKRYAPPLIVGILLKLYFGGSSNTWERKLHGKVYIVTGGTSGVGAALVRELAGRGAQLVLLSSQMGEDTDNSAKTWLTEYVEDLRAATGNELIYVEECDLSSLYSVRKFATRWLDNTPARRLDGVLCLAGESLPMQKLRTNSVDGVEIHMAVNYLGHFQLLTLLEPALRVQPPDRDVRVLVSSCMSENVGELQTTDLLWEERSYPASRPWKVFGTSKLLLHLFAKELQRRLETYDRPDKQPCGVRVNVVNPGLVRSPGLRRFVSMGSVWGLLAYLLLYPLFWVFLKSCEQGMQSYLFAVNSPNVFSAKGGAYIKECSVVGQGSRRELSDELLQRKVFEQTQHTIAALEKASALERNRGKKAKAKAGAKAGAKPDAKSDAKSKTNPAPGSEPDKVSLFKEAFRGDHGLYPDMNSPVAQQSDEGRAARLRRLDAKFAQSRAGAAGAAPSAAPAAD